MRLFLDANVIFSAALSPEGRSRSLFELASLATTSITLLASAHAIGEAERNILLKHPDLHAELETLRRALTVTSEATPEAVRWALELGLPQEDAPILAAAAQAKADLLVTGDRTHFGHLYDMRLRGVLVVTPAEALARALE